MENNLIRSNQYSSFWTTNREDSFEVSGIDNYHQSGYIIHYRNDDSEILLVWDFTDEVETIHCEKGIRIGSCFDLQIERNHLDSEKYLQKESEKVKRIVEISGYKRSTDFLTTVGYFFNDLKEKREMQRLAWAYGRKEWHLKEKPMEENETFMNYYITQKEIAKKVVRTDHLPNVINFIGGVDVAYDDNTKEMVGAIVILNGQTLEIVEKSFHKMEITFPYVPGLFSFREIPPLVEAFTKLKNRPDLIICDGHGVAHPKEAGMASHLGVELDIPTIGCAKKRLIGFYQKEELKSNRGSEVNLIWNNKIIGKVLRTQDNVKPVFVSIGHKISLETAIDWILKVTTKYRLPETTREADHLVNSVLKNIMELDPYDDMK